ncbi:MAG: YfhO family protein, partial [Chloroflexota bacterium]|nr:YfhO family protein [Chloroflexota bacterium]
MVSLAPPIRTQRLARARRWRVLASGPAADVAAILTLLALTAITTWDLVLGGTMVGQDSAAFFYPIFSALGERLAAGDIPGWNPHQFAGIPFAADPESGWMYLPAMLFFTALPLVAAAKTWILFHLLLPGLATLGLGRALGMGTLGALTAAVAYEFSGLLYARNVCCPAYSQVMAWLPALLLAMELAIQSRGWLGRITWWGATGFALSQILAAWLGQGSYYALLAFGGYVLYRTVIAPPERTLTMRGRLMGLILHGAVPFVIGLALAAAAILPRLEYNARTNLAEGYTGDLAWAAVLGGWDVPATVASLLGRSLSYPGGATLALAFAAFVVARGRHAAPYFAALAAGTLILAQRETTWLHQIPYTLLPRFEELHRHWPERVLVAFYLGPAMLAGATVHALARRERPALLGASAILPVLVTLAVAIRLGPINGLALLAGVVAVLGLLIVAQPRGRAIRRLVPSVLILTIFVDLLGAGRFNIEHGPFGGFHKVDLATYYTPNGAAAFLQTQAANGQPTRFFGYDPGIHPGDDTPQLYRYFFADPRSTALLLNNRGTVLGLEDIQGYNPIQPQRYVELIRAINGFTQEYHEANVYPAGLDSPLLNLLNARYILVPSVIPPGRADLERLAGKHPTVYADAQVRVLENRDALPRAWIVHEARQVATGEALSLLASGAVDPRRVALLEQTPPPDVAPPSNPALEEATVTHQEPDKLRVTVRTDAAGLLVLSETVDPAWQAEVDGTPAPILTADHLLRAVPVPAGEHTVELRYESTTLKVGTAISLL